MDNDEECYYYEVINETDDPIMPNIDVNIILIMKDSKRFKRDPFILRLAKKTIFQYNKGYKECEKPIEINVSNKDINHAYYTALEYTKNLNNVIIMEEDAEIKNYNVNHYKIIDNYINNNDYELISFGCAGNFEKFNDYFYKVSLYGFAHAQILSRSSREKLFNYILYKKFSGHIDQHMSDTLNILCYIKPLIIQLFEETENSKTWQGLKNIDFSRFSLKPTTFWFPNSTREDWDRMYIGAGSISEFNRFKFLILLLFILLVYLKYKQN